MIELTKVQFVLSGHGSTQKVEKKLLTSVWFNPSVICSFEQQTKTHGNTKTGLTTVTWSSGRFENNTAVLETPDQIMTKIRLSRATS